MPSMPIYFWDDEDGEKLRESYFDMYPGVWRHGDWIRITERGTAVISGRSDSTINRGGIRMGTAEIYRAVLALDEITDALVVDIAKGDDAWMPLFVVLREGAELDEDLEKAIAKRVREDCSPRHVPSEVFQVDGGPAHAVGQGARGPGQEDPHRHARREGREPRLAREPEGARLVRRARRATRFGVTTTRRGFLAAGAGALAFGPAFWRSALAADVEPGPSPYGPLQAADANGLRLPKGFTLADRRACEPAASPATRGTSTPTAARPSGCRAAAGC